MSRKRFSSEQIIGMLREAEVLQSQGKTIGEVSLNDLLPICHWTMPF